VRRWLRRANITGAREERTEPQPAFRVFDLLCDAGARDADFLADLVAFAAGAELATSNYNIAAPGVR
jgi:hypothetical protein